MDNLSSIRKLNKLNINITDIISVEHTKILNFWTHCPNKPKSHYQLFFICEGSMKGMLNNQTFTVSKNNLLYVPANTNYRSKSISSVFEYICIYFYMEPVKSISLPTVFVPKESERYLNYFKTAEKSWRTKNFGYILQNKAILYDIFRILITEYAELYFTSRGYDSIKESIYYLEKHYCENDITVKQLAQISNITVNHFINLFKECYSVTPKQFINQLRMERAYELLKFSNKSIDEISKQLGYSEASYFSKAFKNITGKSPLSFRNNI